MRETLRESVTAKHDGENIVITIPVEYVNEVLTNPDWMETHSKFKVTDLSASCDYIAKNVLKVMHDLEGDVSAVDLLIVDAAICAFEEGNECFIPIELADA